MRIIKQGIILLKTCLQILERFPMLKRTLLYLGLLLSTSSFAANKSFLLVNATTSSVCSFYASKSYGSTSWEEDIFGPETLDKGGVMNVSLNDGNPNCLYDTKAIMCDGRIFTKFKFNACTNVSLSITE